MDKWQNWLLAGLVGIQVLTFNRLAQVESAMGRVPNETAQFQQSALSTLNQLSSQVNRTADAVQWLSDPQVKVEPGPACTDGRVQVSWSLLKSVPGTRSRLLYRRGEGEPWQEAPVAPGTGQSYVGAIPISGGPGLQWIVWVDDRTAAPGTVHNPAWTYYPPASSQSRTAGQLAVPAYQYQIVAEGPGLSYSTGPLTASLGPALTLGAAFGVAVSTGGQYQAWAEADQSQTNPCLRIKQVTARAFAGESAAGTYPLAADKQRLAATWQSATPLTRVELVVKYGDTETVVPVDLSHK